ncbi:MAG: DUF294 nucleotidyltransferase-like domain-containing protein [Desulfobacterales bacterium]|nr:DUF294 nucleotidyltransferase-like domain-containing protein [Desulfobacterales bacterium]
MRICPRLLDLIRDSLEVGASVTETTDLITAVSDAVVEKFISLAMVETGPAPTDFAFVCLGSEGRREQTLKTDQDNAILFNDLGKGESLVSFQSYFLKLGERVCSWLDKAGYNFCKGGIMANNPRWCQPLSVWKDYFSSWIHTPCPEDLLHACVFFDLRFVYGKDSLADKLSTHLFKALSGWPGFFRDMAENAVFFPSH